MTSTAEVREAIAMAGSYCGREVYPYAQMPTGGSGYVLRREFDPRMVFGQAKVTYPFVVRFYFARGSDSTAQEDIDALCDIAGSGSFLAAVQNGENWPSDLVDYCQVTNVGEPTETLLGATEWLTVDFDLEVVW